MPDFLSNLQPDVAVPVASFIFVIAIVAIVQWRKHRQTELDAGLKRQMIERGMSAEEIVKVLGAGGTKG